MSECFLKQPEFEKDHNQLKKIAEDCEKTIKTTETEIYQYKHDKNRLREEILKILNENQTIYSEYNKLKQLPETNNEGRHEKLTDNAIGKLKDQLTYLKEERDTLHALWKSSQGIIINLESELNNYKQQLTKPNSIVELKQKYQNTVSLLESTIKSVYNELKKQKSVNLDLLEKQEALQTELKNSGHKFNELELKIKESSNFQNTIDSLKNQLITVMRTNTDLETTLKTTKQLVDERLKREQQALEKVQEALQVAEYAIQEKNEAISKESVIREECNYLATTISQVMDDAAARVERNIEQINSDHEIVVNSLKMENQELGNLLENEKQLKQTAELRADNLEKRLKVAFDENIKLDSDLQLASQAIVELELKLESFQSLIIEENKTNTMSKGREIEIQNYLDRNKKITERWKDIIGEITSKFENEIVKLQNKNMFLKTENHELKLKLNINEYDTYSN